MDSPVTIACRRSGAFAAKTSVRVVTTPRLDAVGLATAGDPDRFAGPLVALHLGHGLTLQSTPNRSPARVSAAPELPASPRSLFLARLPHRLRHRPIPRRGLSCELCPSASVRGPSAYGRGDTYVHRLAFQQWRPLDHAVFLDLFRRTCPVDRARSAGGLTRDPGIGRRS